MSVEEPFVRVFGHLREHAAVAHVVTEHHGKGAVEPLLGTIRIQVRTTVEVPFSVNIMAQVVGRVRRRRLADWQVYAGSGDGNPADDVGILALPIVPVHSRERIVLLFLDAGHGRRVDAARGFRELQE